MKTYDITEKDWIKLADFARIRAYDVKKKLPGDYYISVEEISEMFYDEYISLIKIYKPGKRSITSYCHEYAPKRVLSKLFKIYDNLNKTVQYEEEYDEDGNLKPIAGEIDLPNRTTLEHHIETRDFIDYLGEKAEHEDFDKIFKMLKAGMTQRDIAYILGVSEMEISRRIVKFAENFKKQR